MNFSRLLILLMAAALPVVISFRNAVDPIAVKQAIWVLLGGLLFAAGPRALFRIEPAAVFLALAAALSFASPLSKDALLAYLIGVTVFFAARREGHDHSFSWKYLRWTSAVAALVALYGVTQAFWNRYFSQVVLVNPFGDRILSTLGNPTFLADYLAMHLPLGLVLASAARTKRGFASWTLACVAMSAAIVLSGSKGGQLAGLAAAAGWLAFTLKQGTMNPRRFAVLLGVAAAALIPVLFLSSSSLKFSLSRWVSSEQKFSFTQRLEISRGSSALLAQSPLLGAGPGAFPVLFPAFQPVSLYRNLGAGLSVNHAHNDYLEIACETGIAGLGLFLLTIFSGIRAATGGPLGLALALGLLSAAVSMAANFVFYLPSSAAFMWMNAGLLAAAGRKRADAPGGEMPKAAGLAAWLMAALLGAAAVRLLAASCWFDRGVRILEQGTGGGAASPLERAALADPLNRHIWQYLGRAYEMDGRLSDARNAFVKASDLGPYHLITSLNLSRIAMLEYSASARPDALEEALSRLTGVVRINPYQMETRIWGGEMALKSGRMNDARRFLFTAPPDIPGSSQWHRLRHLYFLKVEDKVSAERELGMARRIELGIRLGRIEDRIQKRDLAEAEKLARTLVREYPDSVPALETLGFILHGKRALREAMTCYERMLELEPGSLVAHLNIVLISLSRGDLGRARRHLKHAILIAPDDPEVHLAAARLTGREGDFDAARKEYEWILQRNPGHTQARSELKALPAR